MSDIIRDANQREAIIKRAADLGLTDTQLKQVRHMTLTANHETLEKLFQTNDDTVFQRDLNTLCEYSSAA